MVSQLIYHVEFKFKLSMEATGPKIFILYFILYTLIYYKFLVIVVSYLHKYLIHQISYLISTSMEVVIVL